VIRDKRVIFLSHTHSRGIFRVGSHHLAREFSALGYKVAHVSTPYSSAHALLKKGAEGRREQANEPPFVDDEGVLQVVPRTILPAQFAGSRYLSRVLTQHGFLTSDYMLIDQPLMVSSGVKAFARTTVYRPTDLYVDGVAAQKQRLALSLADGVVATSAEVLRALEVPQDTPSTFIPNGVELARFSSSTTEERDGAIYVGALDDRFDWDAIRVFAQAAPQSSISLVGPVVSAVPPLPDNVKIVGPVPYDDVPRLLAGARLGLLPFSNAVSNRGRSPMKLYEYLASGLFVISRETPVISSYELPGVHTYTNPSDAIDMFSSIIARSGVNADGAASAREQDWSTKALELEAFLRRISS
jgi:teichuronic acid biosynthesis glycosyltransferase TuaH